MSSQQGPQGPPVSDVESSHLIHATNHAQSGASGQGGRGPPYAPLNAGLGGTPTIVPDVPLAVIFLILYLIFGVIHIKIFKGNKHRGHKFIFNGAILGMLSPHILQLAWSRLTCRRSLQDSDHYHVPADSMVQLS